MFFDRNDKSNSQEITLEKPSNFRNKFTGILSINYHARFLWLKKWNTCSCSHETVTNVQKEEKKSSYYVEAVIISHIKLKGAVNVFFHIKFLDP